MSVLWFLLTLTLWSQVSTNQCHTAHTWLFPCCPSPAWLESPPSQQSSLLLLFKTFPRKDAIPTRQLLINALVLFLLNATFLGSPCVTGSPAQVHDWGFTLVPHNCTTLAQFFLWKLQLSCEKVCKWEDIEAMQGRSSINYQKCWGDNTQQLKEENTLQGCKILRRNRVTSQWHQGPSHFQGGTTRLMTAWPMQVHQE